MGRRNHPKKQLSFWAKRRICREAEEITPGIIIHCLIRRCHTAKHCV